MAAAPLLIVRLQLLEGWFELPGEGALLVRVQALLAHIGMPRPDDVPSGLAAAEKAVHGASTKPLAGSSLKQRLLCLEKKIAGAEGSSDQPFKNRMQVLSGIMGGTPPDTILAQLQQLETHAGIVSDSPGELAGQPDPQGSKEPIQPPKPAAANAAAQPDEQKFVKDPQANANEEKVPEVVKSGGSVSFLAIGKTGAGKSGVGNTLLGHYWELCEEGFQPGRGRKNEPFKTSDKGSEKARRGGVESHCYRKQTLVTFYDSDGLLDEAGKKADELNQKEFEASLKELSPSVNAILIVVHEASSTRLDTRMGDILQSFRRAGYTGFMLVYTHWSADKQRKWEKRCQKEGLDPTFRGKEADIEAFKRYLRVSKLEVFFVDADPHLEEEEAIATAVELDRLLEQAKTRPLLNLANLPPRQTYKEILADALKAVNSFMQDEYVAIFQEAAQVYRATWEKLSPRVFLRSYVYHPETGKLIIALKSLLKPYHIKLGDELNMQLQDTNVDPTRMDKEFESSWRRFYHFLEEHLPRIAKFFEVRLKECREAANVCSVLSSNATRKWLIQELKRLAVFYNHALLSAKANGSVPLHPESQSQEVCPPKPLPS